jgi:ABC-type multidrug transport system ATPase subunit
MEALLDPISIAEDWQIAEEKAAPGHASMIEIESLTKRFGDKTALEGVTWKVPRGRICGLLGPNGAGKTTLFRLLMGILKATEGSLKIAGGDAFEDRVRLKRVMGFLPDEPTFYSYLTGSEVIDLGAAMHGIHADQMRRSVDPLVKKLQLADALSQFADDYSRGMKKKLGIILALLHDPDLLILDEPTNGLDVESTQMFFELMREEAAKGKTVVFSTHLIDQVERLCSHVAIIKQGKLVVSGSLHDLHERYGRHRSLEQIFLDLTGSHES